MALVKNSNRFGRKPAAASGRSAAPSKLSAAKKSKNGTKASAKSRTKSSRSSAKFSTLKSRQMTVENVKRTIWASLHRITEALINAAGTGNLATAKELFHFAGVYSLPMPEDENAAVAPAPVPAKTVEGLAPAGQPGNVHPIDEFFARIGIEPSNQPPQADVA